MTCIKMLDFCEHFHQRWLVLLVGTCTYIIKPIIILYTAGYTLYKQ